MCILWYCAVLCFLSFTVFLLNYPRQARFVVLTFKQSLNPTHHFLYHDDLGPDAFLDKEELQCAKEEQHQRKAVEGPCPPEVQVMHGQNKTKHDGNDEEEIHTQVCPIPRVLQPAFDRV